MSNPNPSPSTRFVKGDKRINRKGKPKDFDALRELARMVAHEAVTIGDRKMTVTEAILRQWAQSKNPQLQKGFLEIAYGKVPDNMQIGGNGDAIIIRLVDETGEQQDSRDA
jgi:hypothetical protein